ncbi:MAG: hypothetical protein LIP08_10770 [Bacteroides sp.]|nr:hypothetical protein [Bacteroides sp.]
MTQVSRVSTVKFVQKGETGKPGPLFYPAGIWSQQGEYTRTADLCPFVLYDTGEAETSLYYFLTQEGTFSYDKGQSNKGMYGTPPESMAANGVWKQLDNAGYVFTKFLMADHALLAGAVAYQDKLFSQMGELNGSPSNKYTQNNFVPNLLIDFFNGKIKCKDVDIEGSVKAYSGEFGGFLRTPFTTIEISWPHKLSFDEGFNYIGFGSRETVYLPSSIGYTGVNCNIYVPGPYDKNPAYINLKVEGDKYFVYPGFKPNSGPYYKTISISGFLVELLAFEDFDGVNWYIKNFSEIKYIEGVLQEN